MGSVGTGRTQVGLQRAGCAQHRLRHRASLFEAHHDQAVVRTVVPAPGEQCTLWRCSHRGGDVGNLIAREGERFAPGFAVEGANENLVVLAVVGTPDEE